MNLKHWFGRIFSNNRTDEGIANVRTTGKADGVAFTTAYAEGFLEGVGEVLNSRLDGFQSVIETTATPVPTLKNIEAKRKKPK